MSGVGLGGEERRKPQLGLHEKRIKQTRQLRADCRPQQPDC